MLLFISNIQAQNIQVTYNTSSYQGGNNISCHGASDGWINIIVVGGTAPYYFNWNNGSYNQNLINVPSGTYSVTVTDINGSTGSASIILREPNSLIVHLLPNELEGGYNISENGGNDGIIESEISGGTMDYSYSWSNNSTNNKIDQLSSGTYSLIVTDMNGCTAAASATLTEPAPLHVLSINSPLHHGYNISCYDGHDGSINLLVTGGYHGSGGYNYHWSNGTSLQNPSGLSAGHYSVIISDDNGAVITTQIDLIQPPLFKINNITPSIYSNGFNLSCHACANGSLTVNTSGGVNPVSYQWELGSTSQTISNLAPNVYYVTVTDGNGCTSSGSRQITAPDQDSWSMTGNLGINANNQFIGTKDNNDLVFKTNNTERLRLKSGGEINSTRFTGNDYDIVMAAPNGDLLRVDPGGNPVVNPSPNPSPAPIPCFSFSTCGNNLIPSHFIGSKNNSDLVFKTNSIERLRIKNTGAVVIGQPSTLPGNYKLYVTGGILTEKLRVADPTGAYWADFVFNKQYKLKSLKDLNKFICENKHLPEIPTVEEVRTNGVDIIEMQAKLLQKIEELTLYIIELNEKYDALKIESNRIK